MEKYLSVDSKNQLNSVINTLNSTVYYFPDVIKCLEKILFYSKELYEHSLNVGCLTTLIGGIDCSDKRELRDLCVAALLHDIGKIFISKDILMKKDILTIEERNIIEQHPIEGYYYLQQHTHFSINILNAVLDHHEKVDGSGYHSKKSDTISWYAKIITIADVYDAMVSDRVYRKKIDSDIVKRYLRLNAGKQFDNDLTSKFLKLVDEVELKEIENDFIKQIDLLKEQCG